MKEYILGLKIIISTIKVSIYLWIVSCFGFLAKSNNRKGDGFEYIDKPIPQVLIQSQSVCKEIFSKDTIRPKGLGLGNLFQRWLGDCLGCLNTRDPAWNQLKKIFKPLFDTKEIGLESLIKEEWELEIQDHFRETQLKKKPVSVEVLLANLPLRYILRKVFGKTFLIQNKSKFDSIEKNASVLMSNVFSNKLSRNWLYQFLPTKLNSVFKKFHFNWYIILQLAQENEYVAEEGLYQQLYLNYQVSDNAVSFKMFSQTLVEIIYANKDVVVPSASWLLTHYSLHPKISDPQLFIEESARLSPVFPTSMPKITTTDIRIGDFKIPSGTTVLMDFVALGKSSDWKMNDLDKFRPERYNEVNKYEMITRFGYGSRQCPGKMLSSILFKRMLEHLSQNWILVPSCPTSLNLIKNDPSYPFSMPLFEVWLFKNSSNPRAIFYDCPRLSENTERAFMAISINEKSIFLKDPSKIDMVVKVLAQRGAESIILLADEIAKFNIQAFNHFSIERSKLKARELGDSFENRFKQSIQNFGQGKVGLCRWGDLKLPEDITSSLEKFPELKLRVELIAKNYLDTRGKGKIENSYEKKVNLLTKYIFNELPVLLCGISYQNNWYSLLYYCGSLEYLTNFTENPNSLHKLALDILNKAEYSEIKKKISGLLGRENEYKTPGFIGIDTDKD